ncbi:MAG: SDR family oxidoreductase [Bacteroidales bacterium]|nr:SDR family oxidoreductase [Bacteroidales bacterium]MCF8404533.1 SDR family oxidoreductase [Bacteroidales bacterium]
MSAFNLSGKNVLITGASSGIGRQAALSASEYGATVFITGRDETRTKSTFDKLTGSGHQYFLSDLSLAVEIPALVEKLPPMDGIVHCAGITGHMPAKFIKPSHIDSYFNLNYNAPVLLVASLLKKKKINPKGSIVFISSVTTQHPFFGGSLYVSTKAALEGYSKVLSVEVADKGIRSNCLSPGYVKTAMMEATGATVSQDVMDKVEKAQMLGAGQPEDVAYAIIYFLSDASRWVTGTNLLLGGNIGPAKQ